MTLPNMLLYIAAAILGAALVFLTFPIEASEYHHRNISTTNIINKYNVSGQALSAGLASVDCTYTTKKWHGGVGLGYYDGVGAPVIGACKKFDGALFKAVIGREGENTAGSFSIMYELK